eukprot:1133151-Pelagomonas_calceolata.AAC.8
MELAGGGGEKQRKQPLLNASLLKTEAGAAWGGAHVQRWAAEANPTSINFWTTHILAVFQSAPVAPGPP